MLPPSGRRTCPRVACGPCAPVTVTAADCGAVLGRTARKGTEDLNEAKKHFDEARAKLQEVPQAGCPRRAAPVSCRVACCVLRVACCARQRLGQCPAAGGRGTPEDGTGPAAQLAAAQPMACGRRPMACAEAVHRLCARMGPKRGSRNGYSGSLHAATCPSRCRETTDTCCLSSAVPVACCM